MKLDLTKPDPRLQQAMAEIKKVCEKFDIGGTLILASRTHGEYLVHFPQWSKCYWDAEGLRFKSKANEDREDITSTVHMLQVFQERSFEWGQNFDKILEMVETKLIITGRPQKIPPR